jgi:hypothetical protein
MCFLYSFLCLLRSFRFRCAKPLRRQGVFHEDLEEKLFACFKEFPGID